MLFLPQILSRAFEILENPTFLTGFQEVVRLHPSLRVGDSDRQTSNGTEASEELDGTANPQRNQHRKQRRCFRRSSRRKVIFR
jgi:hypothetical protein